MEIKGGERWGTIELGLLERERSVLDPRAAEPDLEELG
jgi:hypothetical protein